MAKKLNLSKEKLFNLIDREGKTYREVADILGCHHSTVGRYYRQYKEEEKGNIKDIETPKEYSYEDIKRRVDRDLGGFEEPEMDNTWFKEKDNCVKKFFSWLFSWR